MRILFWGGTFLVVALAFGIYWIAAETSRNANSPMARLTGGAFLNHEARVQAEEDENVTMPEEPQPVETTLPAQPIPVNGGNEEGKLQSNAGPEVPFADPQIPLPLGSDRLEKGGFFASNPPFIRMPAEPTAPKKATVPTVRAQKEEDNEEEQEAPPVAKVHERMQQLLENYKSDGERPLRPIVDTMEYRPSDARKGEFERIPF